MSFYLTFFKHAKFNAFLKTTILTSYPVALVDCAVLHFDANILKLFLNRSFEETLASFATLNSVMETRCFVAAHGANSCFEGLYWLFRGVIATVYEKKSSRIINVRQSPTVYRRLLYD